jgi:hypothetical protein
MQFELTATAKLNLKPQLTWLWHAIRTGSLSVTINVLLRSSVRRMTARWHVWIHSSGAHGGRSGLGGAMEVTCCPVPRMPLPMRRADTRSA